jgi:hypothetical protein
MLIWVLAPVPQRTAAPAAERHNPPVPPLDVAVPKPPHALQPDCTQATVPGKRKHASPVSPVTPPSANAAARRRAVR